MVEKYNTLCYKRLGCFCSLFSMGMHLQLSISKVCGISKVCPKIIPLKFGKERLKIFPPKVFLQNFIRRKSVYRFRDEIDIVLDFVYAANFYSDFPPVLRFCGFPFWLLWIHIILNKWHYFLMFFSENFYIFFLNMIGPHIFDTKISTLISESFFKLLWNVGVGYQLEILKWNILS